MAVSWRPDEVADSHGEAPFLVHRDEVWSYRAAARRIREGAERLAGSGIVALQPRPTVDEVFAVLQAMASERTPLLLHPRLTPSERAAAERRLRRAWSGSTEPAADEVWVSTSGSTGLPKAVRLSHAALRAAAEASARNLGWQDGDRWLLSIPPAHVGGASIVVRCLLAGACVVLPDALQDGFRPEAFEHDVQRYGVSLASLVPTMLHRLVRADRWPARLRAALVGGAPTPDDLLRAASAWPVLTTYGLTEAAAQVATQPYGTAPHPGWGAGPPLPGVEVKVRDGRLWVRGPNLMRGYVGAPSPIDDDGYLDTGDYGHLRDGNVHVRGRGEDLILTGGENVFPAEVEGVLRDLPGVDEACVFGVPDPEWGQIVVALVTGEPPGPESVSERLAGFKRPRTVVRVDRLPTTPSGKVSRSAARDWWQTYGGD
jgi:O-succinylbenzoic acid--CoA ligase